MIKCYKSLTALVLAPLLAATSLLWGCSRSAPDRETVYETYTASADFKDGVSSIDENSPEVQEARASFDQFCDQVFRDSLSDNYLNLHYTLADPSAYGLADCPRTFGDFSIDLLREASVTLKEEKARLEAIPVELLTEEQQLTWKILKASYDAEEDFEGLELYYQPLAPTVGVQAQLPVLLAEYIFYGREDVEDYLTLLSSIDGYYQQLLDFEREKSQAGFFILISEGKEELRCPVR